MTSFKHLGLSEKTLKGVLAAGYAEPTPIQATAIPIVRAGRDLMGCAQTGTGKTAAFVLPMLDRLMERPAARSGRPVRALIVTPTRELALQVEEAVRTYGRYTPFRSLPVYGGVGIQPQIHKLRRGVDIVVATPGRLLDLLDRGDLDLSRVEFLVLDEADRMFDMGFIRDVRAIVAAVPKHRQTLLFSATMPEEIRDLADRILTDAEFVEIGRLSNPAETVVQHACSVAEASKMGLLFHLLESEPVDNVIVFSRTKHRADRIARKLEKKGYATAVLHSNRSQGQRQRALDGFRTGRFSILVATDIAARGIDIDGISHVINYDTPHVGEDYIHRIGRTGRALASGDAITFVAQSEEPYLRKIEQHTGKRLPRKVYEGFEPDTRAEAGADQRSRGSAPSAQNRRPGPASGTSGAGRSRSRRRSDRSRSSYRT